MEKKICRDCGCVITGDNYGEDYGQYICADCMEHYVECVQCGDLVHIDHALETQDGYVCDDCACDYVECWECDEYVHEDNAVWTTNGWVCESCANDWYEYCSECGRTVPQCDFNYDLDMCGYCAQDSIIHPYHYCKCLDTKFFKSVLENMGLKPDPNYYLGIEWELCGRDIYKHAAKLKDILGDRINFEADCTVDAEGVFMPHSYDAIIESGEIKQAFEYAKEHLYDEASCAGLHIHVSRTAFGETEEEQDENIAKLAMLHMRGHAYECLYKLSRRTDDEWCRPLSKQSTKGQTAEYAKRYVKEKWNDHNVALNVGNYATVEFRLGAGTVDYDNFINWVKIIRLIVEKCKTISMEDASNFYVWMEDADDSLKDYMEERGVMWEKPIKVTTDDYSRMMETLMDKINANLSANGAHTMDYNTMLSILCDANIQQRVALGYM